MRRGLSPEPFLACWEVLWRAGAGGAIEGRTDGWTEAATFFFVCFILFFIYRFLQKNKSKKFFSIMSL